MHGKPHGQLSSVDTYRLHEHLHTLVSFAKSHLTDQRDLWATVPIYLRATGGMRNIPLQDRTNLLESIRTFLNNKTNCPFYVQYDSIRVLSGEEEAVFAWVGVNSLHDSLLLNSIKDKDNNPFDLIPHSGSVAPPRTTFGSIDLGATSSQISFYVPSQDISDGLFKLQLGPYAHWNLYANSLLQFGYESARLRHMQELASQVSSSFYYIACQCYQHENICIDCFITTCLCGKLTMNDFFVLYCCHVSF